MCRKCSSDLNPPGDPNPAFATFVTTTSRGCPVPLHAPALYCSVMFTSHPGFHRWPSTTTCTPGTGLGSRVSEFLRGLGLGSQSSRKGWVSGLGLLGPPEAGFWSLN